MKQGLIKFITICLLFSASYEPVRAQYILTEADAQFELFNFTKAIELYTRAYKKKPGLHAAQRLAACYKYQSNYAQTENWYAIAAAMKDSPAQYMLEYAKALQNNAKYAEARSVYLRYTDLEKTVGEAQKTLWISSCDSAIKWMEKPGTAYRVENEVKLNSSQSDWGAVKYKDQLVYVSDRAISGKLAAAKGRPFLRFDRAKVPDKQFYGWTGNGYLRLYETGADSSHVFPVGTDMEYHIGPATFSADGETVYFARTRIPENPVYARAKLATVNVELFSSHLDKATGKWSLPEAFPYNNVNGWSVGDPHLTRDGKRLYFASDMPGGKGGMDIYFCTKDAQGKWQNPENLTAINTSGDERSPSFDGNGNFYFSSDGYPGMGGIDIFESRFERRNFSKPVNLGYPINSPQDDFAYTVISDSLAYFASNRIGGAGSDDIYKISWQTAIILKPEKPVLANVGTGQVPTPPAPIIIRNIYYDFNKSNIRPDAALELDKLIKIMEDRPSLWIELGSHTDSRGNDSYNQWLSQRRANSAVQYMIDKGIEKSRITAKGYGENRLLNRCANGVTCSEAEHQLNRRTEFKIVKQ